MPEFLTFNNLDRPPLWLIYPEARPIVLYIFLGAMMIFLAIKMNAWVCHPMYD